MAQMLLKVTPTEEGYRLEGELDMATAGDLGELLRDRTDRITVLDFAGVTFMDSSGLRVLLEAAGKHNGSGPIVVVVNAPAQVLRVLEISIPGGTPGLEVRS
jgi:anti-anti-sigma factor